MLTEVLGEDLEKNTIPNPKNTLFNVTFSREI